MKTSDDFYRRKKLILMNLDRLLDKVQHKAINFDEHQKYKFITLEKARQKQSIVRNFIKIENFKQRQD